MSETEKQYLEIPIIIVGAPRSGTSLLGRLLGEHPQLAYLKEPRLTWLYGNDGKSDMLRAADARPEVCRHIRRSFAGTIQAAGKQRLLEKTPSNSLRMEFVERVLPGCLFVHIMRDGIESALSIRGFWNHRAQGIKTTKLAQRIKEIDVWRSPYYIKEFIRRAMPQRFSGLAGRPEWGPRIPGLSGLVQELDVLEIACLQWRMCVEEACYFGRRLPADRYLECRLEDMSPDLLRSIMEFCQLEPDPKVWKGYEQQFDPQRSTRRRNQTDPQDLETIRRWTESTRHWLEQE